MSSTNGYNINDRQDRCAGIVPPESVSIMGIFQRDRDRHLPMLLPLAMVGVSDIRFLQFNFKRIDDTGEGRHYSNLYGTNIESILNGGQVADIYGNNYYGISIKDIRPLCEFSLCSLSTPGDVLIITDLELAQSLKFMKNKPKYKEIYTLTESGIYYCNDIETFNIDRMPNAPCLNEYVRNLLLVYYICNKNVSKNNGDFLMFQAFKAEVINAIADEIGTFFTRYKNFYETLEGIL